MLVALNYSDPLRRGDAFTRFTEDLLRMTSETRRRLRATDKWLVDQQRREAKARRQAEEARAARAKIVQLVG